MIWNLFLYLIPEGMFVRVHNHLYFGAHDEYFMPNFEIFLWNFWWITYSNTYSKIHLKKNPGRTQWKFLEVVHEVCRRKLIAEFKDFPQKFLRKSMKNNFFVVQRQFDFGTIRFWQLNWSILAIHFLLSQSFHVNDMLWLF